MEIADKVIVVTGAASGVGAAAARRFAADGARVVLTDLDAGGLGEIASELDAPSLAGNIGEEPMVQAVAALARERFGGIDVWFSNAGISGSSDASGIDDNGVWQLMWNLHVMSHVYAARAVLPEMLARGEGYLLQTASQVALVLQQDRAHYTVTKQATLSFAEWLAANYRGRGIRVSCFCPGPMDTPMLRASGLPEGHSAFRRALSGEQVADLLVQGLRAEKFLIDDSGPVDGTGAFAQKITDYDGWLTAVGRPHA